MKTQIKSKDGIILYESEKNNATLRETIVEAHQKGVNLDGANLCNVDLSNLNLSNISLIYADLRESNLYYTDLHEADLANVNLVNANLCFADLYKANLRNVLLFEANLSYSNLCGTNFYCTKLSGANLNNVRYDTSTLFFLPQCPEEGSFIGWKKCKDYIVKLLIPESAKRSSATTLKCRCSRAKVLDIENIDGTKADIDSVASNYDPKFIYKIDEIVKVDDFDDDRWEECSTGIHFFISKDIATKYSFL